MFFFSKRGSIQGDSLFCGSHIGPIYLQNNRNSRKSSTDQPCIYTLGKHSLRKLFLCIAIVANLVDGGDNDDDDVVDDVVR